MAITSPTTTSAAGSTGTAITAALTPAINDIIIVDVHSNYTTAGAAGTFTVSDNQGNVYNLIGSSTSAASGHVQMTSVYWAKATSASSTTISVSASGSPDYIAFTADTFRGVDTVNPVLDTIQFYTNYTSSLINGSVSQTISDPRVATVSYWNTAVRPAGGTAPSGGPSGFSGVDFGASVGFIGAGIQVFGSWKFETATGTDTYNWGLAAQHYNIASFTLRPALTKVAQATGGATTATSVGATMNAAVEVNDYLVCVIHIDAHTNGTNTSVTGISDGHNTWALLSGGASSSTAASHAQRTEIWGALNTFAGTLTITPTIAAARDDWSFVVEAFRGVNTITPIRDAPVFSTNYTATAANNATSITPTGSPCAVVATFTYDNQSNPGGSFSGFTGSASVSAGAGSTYSASQMSYEVVNSTSSVSLGLGASTNNWWAVGAFTLRAPSATVIASGTITTSLTKASQALVGKENYTGTIHTNLTKASQSVQGRMDAKGTITTTLTKASQAAAGKENYTGTITTTLTKASQAAAGTITGLTGSIVTRLSRFSQTAQDTETFTGTITTSLSSFSQLAQAPANISATIHTSLNGFRNAAVAEETIPGHIVSNIDLDTAFSIQAVTYELFFGHITTRLSPASFAAVAVEEIIGHAATHLGSSTGQIVANVIEGSIIIQGPMRTDLPPFRPLALGAQLGAAGSGKWYSWRYADR